MLTGDKICDHHRRRKAVLYVRQSSPHQLLHNEESRRLQYAMATRVRALGWTQVDVVDDDLGRSASGAVTRVGFEKMVAEVCLGEVGAVAARELSRFARNSHDWQQLIEVCRVVDTLLLDQEAVYDARNSNDRLLLGLKGSMSEYELDLLRLRSSEAREAKARRGEFLTKLPPGYSNVDGRLERDPDQRVQQAVRLVFDKVVELGSARQAFEWLLEAQLELPCRVGGARLEWRRPTYAMVLRMLRNPTYAGAYAYGRTQTVARLTAHGPRRVRVRKGMENWSVLLRDHHPAYISWDRFQRVRKMLSDNEPQYGGAGAAKRGTALLAGLLRCQHCGRRLAVAYHGPDGRHARYSCRKDFGAGCLGFGGHRVDLAVTQQLLRVVRPGAIEAAASAARERAAHEDGLVAALRLELEGARYAAERAHVQYEAADARNRLVAGELEHRWEAALQHVADLEQRLGDAAAQRRAAPLPSPEQLARLAHDFDRVWDAPTSDTRLKKRLVRTLIEEIIVGLAPDRRRLELVIHWKGGVHSSLSIPKLSTGQHPADTPVDIVAAIQELALVCSDKVIASYLGRNQLKTGRGERWTWKHVAAVRNYRGTPPASKQPRGEWLNLEAAAALLGIDRNILSQAAVSGAMPARHPLPVGPWIFARTDLARNDLQLPRDRRKHRRRSSEAQLNLSISSVSDKGAV